MKTSTLSSAPSSPVAPSLVSEIVALHGEILTAATSHTRMEDALRMGDLLTAQKASLKHGQWLLWLRSNVPFCASYARGYMRCREELERTLNCRCESGPF